MKEGTKSVLFGCHSFIHSFYVLKAWTILHKEWPNWWQIICIMIHDIGYLGKNYLSNKEEYKMHWFLGARLAGELFGKKGFDFVASHTKNPWVPLDPKFKAADRFSWVIASDYWLNWNKWVEKYITPAKEWKKICLEGMKDLTKANYELYLEIEGNKKDM